MKIRFFSLSRLAMAVALFVQAASAQYTTLTAGPGKLSSQTVTLVSNELATVVHLSTDFSNSALEVVSGGITNLYNNYLINGGSTPAVYFKHANLPVIAGPATLRVVSTGPSYVVLCTLQITKPTSTFVPVNTVVIPNDSGAPVQIILESSTDMIRWNAASPGTYGTSSTNRFFRVRAER